MKHLKLLALLLALVMTVSLFTGCVEKEPASGEVISHEEETTPETEAPTEEAEEPTEEPAPEELEPPTEANEENPTSLGRMDGGVYTNTYAGFGCELDANWSFYTAEELQELPENIQEVLADTDLGNAIDDYQQIMDMSAENVNDLTIMNVLYTKQPMNERLVNMTRTEKETLEASLGQYDMLADAYLAAGIELVNMEVIPVTFLGEDHYALKSTAVTQGVDYYILQIQNYKLGSYGITLTVGSYIEDKTEDLLDLFFAVD